MKVNIIIYLEYTLNELLTALTDLKETPTSDQLSIQSQMILSLGQSQIGPLSNQTVIIPDFIRNILFLYFY